MSKKGYNLFTNQCAQVVRKSLEAVGFDFYYEQKMHLNGINVNIGTLPYTPQMTIDVLKNKYKGILLQK